MKIVLGNSFDANASDFMRGWVVGHMHDGLTQSNEFEIKLFNYRGPINYGKKSFGGTEVIIIYGGILSFNIEQEINGELEKGEVVLRGNNHEYVIFPPGTNKTVEVLEAPAFGVTVRWPSGPDVNKVLLR